MCQLPVELAAAAAAAARPPFGERAADGEGRREPGCAFSRSHPVRREGGH